MSYLALDTSTEYLSLALSTPQGIVGRSWLVGQQHAELTLPHLRDLLADHQIALTQIQGIAFGMGPGSFTGLRIGCGIAQGLALPNGIPLLGMSTLEALAQSCQAERVIACLDARMNQVYSAAYLRQGEVWQVASEPQVCDPDALPLLSGTDWVGVGSGFQAYGPVLQARVGAHLARIEPNRMPLATDMLALALPRFQAGEGVPAHQATLLYLRDKVALKTSERTKA